MEFSAKRKLYFQALVPAGRGIRSVLPSHCRLLRVSKALFRDELIGAVLHLQPGICGDNDPTRLLAGRLGTSKTTPVTVSARRQLIDASLLSLGFLRDSSRRLDLSAKPRTEDL